MKKILLRALICAVLAAGCFSGCAPASQTPPPEQDPQVVAGVKYSLTLSETSLSAYLRKSITLPRPAASDGGNNDFSDSVEVEVLYEDGSVYIPRHRYSAYSAFSAYKSGKYYAVYTLCSQDGAVVAKSTAEISVTEKQPYDTDIVIDGVLNDEKYSLNPTYYTGVDNRLQFKYYFAEDGLYLGVNVSDDNLVYSNYVVSKFTQSDGFEVYLNLSEERSDILNDKCFKLQVGLNGEVWLYSASTGLTVFELNERLTPNWKLQIHGTRSLAGSSGLSAYDTDEGYTFEMFIDYGQLGIADLPDVAGIAFAHRDVSDTNISAISEGSAANVCYKDVVLPDDLTQILLSNGNNYSLETYDCFALTCLYRKLYIGRENSGIDAVQTAPVITVDGHADESIWSNATEINYTATSASGEVSVKAKAFKDRTGLYACVEVGDGLISSRRTADIYNGDCVQLRVATGDTVYSDTLPKGMELNDKVLTVCPTGKSVKSYLNGDSILFCGGFDALYAVSTGEGVYSIEIFIPSYELGLEEGGTAAICIGVIDNDDQSYLSSVADMAFSCEKDNPSLYTLIGDIKS